MACALPVSYGLDQLVPLSEVHIKQKKTIVNEYVIQSPDEKVLYYAKEDATTMGVLFSAGKDRQFHMQVFDTQQRELFWIRRPLTWGPDKMEVMLASGQLVSIIRQKRTFFKPVLYLNDANDQMIFKIKSNTMVSQYENNFMLYAPNGQEVGYIAKIWKGFKREMFTKADNFIIKFPDDLDVRYKAAVISACFLIDFLFYEGK